MTVLLILSYSQRKYIYLLMVLEYFDQNLSVICNLFSVFFPRPLEAGGKLLGYMLMIILDDFQQGPQE